MKSLKDTLARYLAQLSALGAVCPKVLNQPSPDACGRLLSQLHALDLPEELRRYFELVDGYDPARCATLGTFEPEFAWDMFPIPLGQIAEQYELMVSAAEGAEEPDYYPEGFVPILMDGAGNYLVVNAIKGSPTYGAVYDMGHGEGCKRVAGSLADFFVGYSELFVQGIRRFDGPGHSSVVDRATYFSDCARVFGDTPYLRRVDALSPENVDWR